MQFMLLVYLDENSLTKEQREKCYADSAGYARQLAEAGKCIAVSPLQPTSTALSVRSKGDKQVIVDGPFAETREQLGGFFLVQEKDRAEAVEIARKIPAGRRGTVEVRPVLEIGGLPTG
jgi:hypothetical protein